MRLLGEYSILYGTISQGWQFSRQTKIIKYYWQCLIQHRVTLIVQIGALGIENGSKESPYNCVSTTQRTIQFCKNETTGTPQKGCARNAGDWLFGNWRKDRRRKQQIKIKPNFECCAFPTIMIIQPCGSSSAQNVVGTFCYLNILVDVQLFPRYQHTEFPVWTRYIPHICI